MSELPLPKGWTQAALGDLAEFTNGKAFKKGEWLEAGKPIIRIQNLNNPSALFNYADDSHEEKYLVQHGDLLVSWSASLGVYYWFGEAAWLNQHIFRVHNLRGCDKRFLKYALEISIDAFYAKAHGMGMVHITKGNFENHLVPLPPLAEQIRIAQKLDELLSQTKTLKTCIDSISPLLKRFRQSVLAAAMSGRLTEQWRSQAGTPIPASNWSDHKLGDICSLVTSGSRGWADYYSDSGAIFIRSQDINTDELDITDTAFVSLPQASEGKRTRVQVQDLLITITGANVGKVARVKQHIPEAYVSQHVALVRLDNPEFAPFVELYLKDIGSGRGILTELAYGGGKPGLNLSNIRDLLIPLPLTGEQTEIVRRVEDLFAFADQLEAKVVSAQRTINRLPQSILAKAFRGKLAPQDLNDEPASNLLKRIKAQRSTAHMAKRGRKSN